MATASSSDESVGKYSDEDRIRNKKPKSKSKTKSSKRRRHRRRHSSLSSSYSSDSDSDGYNSRKREKPKKKRRRKEKELAKSDKKKSQKKKKKKRERRHDAPSASSSSPVRRLKSRKRCRSPSPSPSCSTCSSRGRSPLMDGRREKRLPKSPDVTDERWEERDKVIEAYDDYQSSRKDGREADVAENDELGETRFASVVQSSIGDIVVEEEEKSIGVGNARLASVVGSANYDMAVEEEEGAGSADNAGKDAVALELILRQKALENFRKFRVGFSVNKEFNKPAVDRRIGSSDEWGSIPNQPIKVHGYSNVRPLEQSQSGLSANKGFVGNRVAASSSDVGITTNQVKKVQGSTNMMVLSEQTTGAKVAQDKKLVSEPGSGKVHRSEVSVGDKKEAVKPAMEGNFPNLNSTETSKPTVSRTFSKPIKGGSMQNEAKVEESSNRLLSEQAVLAKVAKDKTLVTETGGDKAHTSPSSIGDGSIPSVSCPIKDDENCKSNEPMVNSATGSEFEQKTFCRVRDGETVQVKYKVYIPKKTPALARRKLQR